MVVTNLVHHRVPFAFRFGGHSPNPFDANINDSVLASLGKLDKVAYDIKTGLVIMGPGARWDAVYTERAKFHETVVGGRVLNIGFGGLNLGSGLSYLTDLLGLICDTVVSYEVRTVYPAGLTLSRCIVTDGMKCWCLYFREDQNL
ncbi:hypothetical protein F5Y15DRAFT_373234 [Xylariaceae sp. FL0016]|nr:hypothetical protein F5Y15DRAFT_373234 [Xylariaceae sp. FL0016]